MSDDLDPVLPEFLLAMVAEFRELVLTESSRRPSGYRDEAFRKVLVSLDAVRFIVELHTLTVRRAEQSMFNPFTGERHPDEYDVLCEVCGWASSDPSGGCETLRLLALPYANHPDYRQGWGFDD